MTLKKRKYSAIDALWLTMQISPFFASLRMVLTLIHALMPTAVMALVLANFVDTATAILAGSRPRGDIYPPLVLLLLALCIVMTIGSIIALIVARVDLDLQRKLKPAFAEKCAALDYKHIESVESWELISRVSRDPVQSFMTGFDAFMRLLLLVVSMASVVWLTVTHVKWAAVSIIVFSLLLFGLSLRAGKKNYQASQEREKFNRRTEYLDDVLTGRENVEERTLFGYGDKVSENWRTQYEAARVTGKLKRPVCGKQNSLHF